MTYDDIAVLYSCNLLYRVQTGSHFHLLSLYQQLPWYWKEMKVYLTGHTWQVRHYILCAYYLYVFLGVTIIELVLSELLLYSIIGIAQVAVIVTIVYAIFDVRFCSYIYMRPFLTYYFLYFDRLKCMGTFYWLPLFTG